MNIHFTGKRALVTGAGRGIGREVAKALAKGGAETFALSRTQSTLDSLRAEVPTIKTVCVDLGDWDSARQAVELLGPIDLLVNNAGVGASGDSLEVGPEEYDRIMNINIKAAFNMLQVAGKSMVAHKKGGAIVNMSSQAGQAALQGHALYGASKAALDQMTRVFALELGPHKIRTNSVQPTVVLTDMGRDYWNAPERKGPMLAKIPLGRFAEIEDVVHAVLFLLSDQASMINGVTLPIDGGFLAA